jgi:RHS repeat-associated protein
VKRNGVTVGDYAYDVYDQRIGKVTPAGTERFVYGQNQNIALEFDGSGSLTNRYLHGNSIDEVLADEANGSVGWALTDNLGSVRDVVDDTGTSQNHVVFDSFGNVTSETNPGFDTRFSFTGREFDAETGNYDYRHRPLNPRSGRFIEEDPVGLREESLFVPTSIPSSLQKNLINQAYNPRRQQIFDKEFSNLKNGNKNPYIYANNRPIDILDPLGLWGTVVGQTRAITYRANGGWHSTNNIQEVIDARNQGYSVSITFDLTEAVIIHSGFETGTAALQSIIPPDFQPGDNRGHIVGKQLGGTGAIIHNLFAQNASINQSRLYGYEDRVRRYLDSHQLQCPEVGLLYSFNLFYNSGSLRPYSLSSQSIFSDGHVEITRPVLIPNP